MDTIQLQVRVIANASQNILIHEGNYSYKIKVMAPPAQGKANEAVVRLLAKQYGVPRSYVQVVRGLTSNYKVIEIKEAIQISKRLFFNKDPC